MIYRSRYPLVFALLLAAGLSGCIAERFEEPGNSNSSRPVVFAPRVAPNAGTRALDGHPVENVPGTPDAGMMPDGRSFGVYAWEKITPADPADNFADLQNMKVTRDGTHYIYEPIANWPREQDATLSFFAYYPHSASADAAGRIAASRGTGADQWMKIAYTVPADAGQHIDLMYAKVAMTTGYDPVNLDFRHALARLKFEAHTDGYPSGAQVKITGIKVKGAVLKGELVVLDPATQPGKPWWELDDAVKGDMSIPAAQIKDIVLTESLQAVIPAGGDMLVLPQEVDGLTIEVTATLNGTAFAEPVTFLLDGTPDWTMNEIITYEITLAPDGMQIAAKIADWTTDPVSVIHDGQWWLSVNGDNIELDPNGDEFTLTAETNYNISSQGYPAGLQINAAEISYISGGDGWLTLTNIAGANGGPTREIKLTAPANSTGTRSAKIKIQAGNLTKIVNVTQAYVPPSYPAYPGVIGYDPESKKLNLDGVGVMVYFKFGSVVAMYSGRNTTGHDGWNGNSSVAFNPSEVDCTAYVNVPYANATTFPAHDPANGKGDPCKLVGLTLEEIKEGTKTDNGAWRLPTGNPFEKFATSSIYYKSESPTVKGNVTEYDYVAADNTVADGGYGNIAKISLKDDAAKTFSGNSELTTYELLLPAAGNRDTFGTVIHQGSGGYFWSSTPISSGTNGYSLNVTSTGMYPAGGTTQSYGFSVRCVRQP